MDYERYEEMPRPSIYNRKKNTRKFCKGKRGVPHQYEIQVSKHYQQRIFKVGKCYWYTVTSGYHWYVCHHEKVCIRCGRADRVPKTQCPDYKEY